MDTVAKRMHILQQTIDKKWTMDTVGHRTNIGSVLGSVDTEWGNVLYGKEEVVEKDYINSIGLYVR